MTDHIQARLYPSLLWRRVRDTYTIPGPYGFIAGTVQVDGIATQRLVRCYEVVTGRFVGATWSKPDGSFRFEDLDVGLSYVVMAFDYEKQFNVAVADQVVPAIGPAPAQQPGTPAEAVSPVVAPVNPNLRYDVEIEAAVYTWHNPNWGVAETQVFRSGTPMDPEDLPTPLAVLPPSTRRYVDTTFITGQTYYWRVAFVQGGQVYVSDEEESAALGTNPFQGVGVGDFAYGGYYSGLMLDEADDSPYGLITGPYVGGSGGAGTLNWASSLNWAAGLTLNGYADWTLPTLDECYTNYRAFKPATTNNVTNAGATDRVDPPLPNFTTGNPSQTPLPAWQTGGSEAFVANTYWTRTEVSTNSYTLSYSTGAIASTGRTNTRRYRAVRRVYV